MDGDIRNHDILGGLHAMIPFGVAQTGFVGAAFAVAVLGVVPAHGPSIMDNTVPLPTVLLSFGALVGATWAVSRYTRSFATRADLEELEKRLAERMQEQKDDMAAMIRKEMERKR